MNGIERSDNIAIIELFEECRSVFPGGFDSEGLNAKVFELDDGERRS